MSYNKRLLKLFSIIRLCDQRSHCGNFSSLFFTKEFVFDVSSFLGLTFYTELLSGGEQKIEL